jgi:tetratricopeptide (TPR) repeat protein
MKYNFKLSSILISLLICFSIAKSHAQSSSDYHKLGDKKDQKGKFKSAVKLYQKALDLDPNNLEILEKIVFAKSNSSQYSSAIDNLNTMIQLKPQSSKFYYLRGFFQFNLKNYNAAVQDYSKAIVFQEDKISDFNIYSERGLCKMRLKDYSGAIEDFNRTIAMCPDAGIAKLKSEAEIKLKENPPAPKYRAVQTNVHHIVLKKTVLNTN